MDLTELNAIDNLVRLYATDLAWLKKRCFIEIDSSGEGGRFKRSDISYTGVAIGLEGPVLLGFLYYMAK